MSTLFRMSRDGSEVVLKHLDLGRDVDDTYVSVFSDAETSITTRFPFDRAPHVPGFARARLAHALQALANYGLKLIEIEIGGQAYVP